MKTHSFERFMITAGGIGASPSSMWDRNWITALKSKDRDNLRINISQNGRIEEVKIISKLVLRSEPYSL